MKKWIIISSICIILISVILFSICTTPIMTDVTNVYFESTGYDGETKIAKITDSDDKEFLISLFNKRYVLHDGYPKCEKNMEITFETSRGNVKFYPVTDACSAVAVYQDTYNYIAFESLDDYMQLLDLFLEYGYGEFIHYENTL